MGKRLKTRPSRSHTDVAAFFDAGARGYAEQHGDSQRLLQYRLALLRTRARLLPDDTVLEIGCGSGLHLTALAGEFGRGIGTDLSRAMIAVARERLKQTGWESKIAFDVDAGEHVRSVADSSIDVVLCVGALEHMLDQAAVFRSAFRVLRPGGRLVCLTLNGGSVWYRHLAPLLGFDTRQLETDRYLTRGELRRLVTGAGFAKQVIDCWTFVQRGDMPEVVALVLDFLDAVGRWCRMGCLRGGLRVCAVK
jgi:ubiquinone/menaquinone biosynthesis C-methylase UbiE